MKKKKLSTNRDALRWCKRRRATITFDYLGNCEIRLGTLKRTQKEKSLIKAVNAWINYFNEKEGLIKLVY